MIVGNPVCVCVGEFGDFDPSDHQPGYLEDFPYLEDKVSGRRDGGMIISERARGRMFEGDHTSRSFFSHQSSGKRWWSYIRRTSKFVMSFF